MKPILISLALTGCIPAASMTYSAGGGSYYPHPSSSGVATPDEEPGEESAPAPSGKITCVRDNAGGSFASATKLTKGTYGGCLDTTELDVYALTAGPNPGGTMFGVTMQSKEAACAQLFDQDKKYITSSECTLSQHTQYLWAAVAPNTTVYVKMTRLNQHISPYRLEVTEAVIADDEEPNNTWAAAIPLALDTPHSALMADLVNDKATMRDLYKVVLTKPQKLSVVVDPNADDVRPEVTIYDVDRRKLDDAEADNQGAVLRMQTDSTLKPGTYYVAVATSDWGIGYGNGPAGSELHGAEHPTGHYTKPYQIEISTIGEVRRNKPRVSRR